MNHPDSGINGLVQAAIFDMDGTLVDSEPFWMQAEFEIFQKEGIKLTEKQLQDAKGLPTADAVKFWLADHDSGAYNKVQMAEEIDQKAEELILNKGEIMPGAMKVLEFFKERNLPLAIASASTNNLIEAVIKKHKLENYFDLLYSGDNEPVGKPHPGIYLSTAKKLNVKPSFCVVFEDSIYGILSAKAANMKVVAFLSDVHLLETKYDIADMKLESFHNFGLNEYKYLELLMKNH